MNSLKDVKCFGEELVRAYFKAADTLEKSRTQVENAAQLEREAMAMFHSCVQEEQKLRRHIAPYNKFESQSCDQLFGPSTRPTGAVLEHLSKHR